GTAMGIGWIFLYEAYIQAGVGVATLLYYCGPMIVMILSPFLFHEKITAVKFTGFCFVLFGMFLVNGSSLLRGKQSFGLLLGLLSALMFAVMIIFAKKACSITGLESSMYQLMASFLTVMVYTFCRQGIALPSISGNLVPVLFLGIVNTGIGTYLYFSSMQKLPVQSVSVCGYLEPLSALFFSIFFLQEHLSFSQTTGAFFIIGGAALGELFHPNPNRKRKVFFHLKGTA
ncbi:MAG: EamA family transporter, partial [Lachnospiraceae bacterium]|nr:EamA family transporter [Lachnospiraceae bacterium]